MGTVTVRIPAPLRSFTGGNEAVVVSAGTVAEVVEQLGRQHEGIGDRILGPDGEPRQFVNLFLGDQNVRDLEGLTTPVAEGDVLSIIPAVAGGER